MVVPRTSRTRPLIRKFPEGIPRFRKKQNAGSLSKKLFTKKFGPLTEVNPAILSTLTDLAQRNQRLKRQGFDLHFSVLRGRPINRHALNRL
ncbi:MAG: hypothetical protein ABIJ74_03085 [archaeon]